MMLHDVQIMRGRADLFKQNTRFEWYTFALHVGSTVHEFVPETRIGWFDEGKDLDTYHTWLFARASEGCQVVT